MKKVMRLTGICLCAAMVFSGFFGCSSKKEKVYDPQNDPKQYIEHYERIMGLVGTERMATLEALGYTLQDVKVDDGNYDYMGLPLQAEYGGVTFDISIRFDYNEATLRGVDYTKTYAYPEEGEQAIQDILKLGEQMARDLGEPDEVDAWNDWFEEENKVEMDPDPPTYKNEAEIRKLIEMSMGGGLAVWDITGFTSETVRDYKTAHYGSDVSTISLNFYADTKYGDESITVELRFL